MTLLNFDVRFTPKSGHAERNWDVRFVPQADILRCSRDWRYDHLVGGGEFLLDTFSGWHGARPAHPEYSAKPQEEGAVIAKSNVPPIANFIDGIFSVERSAMTAGFSVRGSPVVNI